MMSKKLRSPWSIATFPIFALCHQKCLKFYFEGLINLIISCLNRTMAVWWHIHDKHTLVGFIYILDSINSSTFTFWSNKFSSSSRCNWKGIWNGNWNGSWTDKHSSLHSFSCKNHNKQILKWSWNDVEILLN